MNKYQAMTKKEKKNFIFRSLEVILGTLILAFGQVIFIERCVLVTGGLASIGNIINEFIPSPNTVRITVVVLNIVCFLLGLICLGKSFSAKTLLSTIVYTLFYPIVSKIIQSGSVPFLVVPVDVATGTFSETTLFLAAIFGGVLSGIGIALTLIGGGSTGGVDVFAIIISKITHTKVSIWIFIVDAVVVVLGAIFVGENNSLIYFLICVSSCLCCSLATEFILSKRNNSYVVYIVSDKWQEINDFIIKDLDRGSTLINVEGGYKNEKHKMIQAVISRDQYSVLLSKISEIDKDAFVTINSAHEVNGEGFKALPKVNNKKDGGENERKEEQC